LDVDIGGLGIELASMPNRTSIGIGFLQYTIRHVRPVEKGLVCNRKGPIKDLAVEINSIQLVF
jgi:hypothetical protein